MDPIPGIATIASPASCVRRPPHRHYFAPEEIEVIEGKTRGVFVDGGVSPYNNPALAMLQVATLPARRLLLAGGSGQAADHLDRYGQSSSAIRSARRTPHDGGRPGSQGVVERRLGLQRRGADGDADARHARMTRRPSTRNWESARRTSAARTALCLSALRRRVGTGRKHGQRSEQEVHARAVGAAKYLGIARPERIGPAECGCNRRNGTLVMGAAGGRNGAARHIEETSGQGLGTQGAADRSCEPCEDRAARAAAARPGAS